MKLPNGDQAVVEDEMLRDYCLSPTHPRGRHKARLFASALGLTQQDVPLLRSALLDAAAKMDAQPTRKNAFGRIYELRCTMIGPTQSAQLLSVWIVLDSDPRPRLVTCYPG